MNTVKELNISHQPIQSLISYNKKLHNKKKLRNVYNMNEAFSLVKNIYNNNYNDHSNLNTILIVDDVIRSGATINRIAYLLKNQGVKSIYGFAWLRAIGLNPL